MATEKRLIDANAMRQDWLENGENEFVYDTNAVLYSIDAQPTVDAVEVVRCKDCVFNENGCCTHSEYYDDTRYRPDYFCADGERKDELDGI